MGACLIGLLHVLQLGIPQDIGLFLVLVGHLCLCGHHMRAQAAEKTLLDQENNIIREVRVAWLNANNALERLHISEQLLVQARLSFDLAQARYKGGLSSIVELSQAQLNVTAAEIEQASARYEYQIQRAVLDYQVGIAK